MSDVVDDKQFLAALLAEDVESASKSVVKDKDQTARALLKREAPDDMSGITATKRIKRDPEVEPPADEKQSTTFVPLVWSNNRQALCDAVKYFKSHQGGLYTQGGKAEGLLIGGGGFEARDKFGAQVVITTMGGGRDLDGNGNYVRTKNQKPRSFEFWKKSWDEGLPIVVIAGKDHPEMPCKTDRKYSVLDCFWITSIWTELTVSGDASDGIYIYKVRLEKINLNTRSWWWDESSDNALENLAPCAHGKYTVDEEVCATCTQSSKQIFTEGWTCLNGGCHDFFNFPEEIDYNTLTYTDDFLGERTVYPGDKKRHPLPNIVPDLPSAEAVSGTSVEARVGIVCPDCGCCSRRRYWTRWECENSGCHYVLGAALQVHQINDVKTETEEHDKTAAKRRERNLKDEKQSGDLLDDITITLDKSIPMKKYELHSYKASIYALPGSNGEILGCVVVFRASEAAKGGPYGANALYEQLQSEDIGLHRNPARCPGAWNETYTRHFQQNFGAPYKFGVAVGSESFMGAPDIILRILARLQWAGQTAAQATGAYINRLLEKGTIRVGDDTPVNIEWENFNELLALGYMEKDEISYHDDGEKQLGPTVATLSLGSPAMMKFRPKKKMTSLSARGRKGNPAKKDNSNRDYHDVLEVCLDHGDIVVMQGRAIHREYDHAVEPSGHRRFALTTRVIREDSIPEADKDRVATMSAFPPHYESFEYNGDITTTEQAAALREFTGQ